MTSQLIGMTVAAAAGGDTKAQEKAAWVAQQATVYNNLNHAAAESLLKEIKDCRAAGGCGEEKLQGILGKYESCRPSVQTLSASVLRASVWTTSSTVRSGWTIRFPKSCSAYCGKPPTTHPACCRAILMRSVADAESKWLGRSLCPGQATGVRQEPQGRLADTGGNG